MLALFFYSDVVQEYIEKGELFVLLKGKDIKNVLIFLENS